MSELAAMREIAEGMAACVREFDRRNLWFSRSHDALLLRDSLRTWADDLVRVGQRCGINGCALSPQEHDALLDGRASDALEGE